MLRIPQTSKDRYLGGHCALNLLSERGTGDWHQSEWFETEYEDVPRAFLCGRGRAVDTVDIFGESGIYDCASILDAMHIEYPDGPVWAASHARAIADLVLDSVIRDVSPRHVRFDDWMPSDEDKREVLELLAMAKAYLSSEQIVTTAEWARYNGHHWNEPPSEFVDLLLRELGFTDAPE